MPITDDGHVEYKIPLEIKNQFNKKFMYDFQSTLLQIFPKAVGTVYCESYIYLTSTAGWCEAFEKTCDVYELEFVLKYYKNLEWYDKDLFDGEFGDLLVEYGLVESGEQVTIKGEDIEEIEQIGNVLLLSLKNGSTIEYYSENNKLLKHEYTVDIPDDDDED